MASQQSKLLQTALRVIDGYNQWEIEAILAPRAPNCVQQVYPARLNRPANNNDAYRGWLTQMMPLFHSFHVTILDTIEDTTNNKVVFHARSEANTVIGPYANEYMLIMEMTSDHEQLLSLKEFVDSGYSQDFMVKLREHASKQQPQ